MKRLDQRYEPVTIANQDDVGSNRSSNRPLLEIQRRGCSAERSCAGS
jgi:hypothetical protein